MSTAILVAAVSLDGFASAIRQARAAGERNVTVVGARRAEASAPTTPPRSTHPWRVLRPSTAQSPPSDPRLASDRRMIPAAGGTRGAAVSAHALSSSTTLR
jgi:hypothetical protein